MELSKEDKKILDAIVNQLKQAVITGGEVSMTALSKYVANLAPSTVSDLSRMFKKYGYFGVFFAIQDSLQQGIADPLYKYILATLGFVAATGTGCVTASALVIALAMGLLVDEAWKIGEWIAENQEDIVEKIKKLLSDNGLVIGENGSTQCSFSDYLKVCPLPKKETICKIKTLFDTGSEVRSPLVVVYFLILREARE